MFLNWRSTRIRGLPLDHRNTAKLLRKTKVSHVFQQRPSKNVFFFFFNFQQRPSKKQTDNSRLGHPPSDVHQSSTRLCYLGVGQALRRARKAGRRLGAVPNFVSAGCLLSCEESRKMKMSIVVFWLFFVTTKKNVGMFVVGLKAF